MRSTKTPPHPPPPRSDLRADTFTRARASPAHHAGKHIRRSSRIARIHRYFKAIRICTRSPGKVAALRRELCPAMPSTRSAYRRQRNSYMLGGHHQPPGRRPAACCPAQRPTTLGSFTLPLTPAFCHPHFAPHTNSHCHPTAHLKFSPRR